MAEILITDPDNWLLRVLYTANKTDVETYRVFKCLRRYFTDTRQYIGVTEEIVTYTLRFKPLTDLADDCLFSVAVFPGHIDHRHNRRGAPSVEFYSNTGKHAFSQTGYNCIAHRWSFWTQFINTHIASNK